MQRVFDYLKNCQFDCKMFFLFSESSIFQKQSNFLEFNYIVIFLHYLHQGIYVYFFISNIFQYSEDGESGEDADYDPKVSEK